METHEEKNHPPWIWKLITKITSILGIILSVILYTVFASWGTSLSYTLELYLLNIFAVLTCYAVIFFCIINLSWNYLKKKAAASPEPTSEDDLVAQVLKYLRTPLAVTLIAGSIICMGIFAYWTTYLPYSFELSLLYPMALTFCVILLMVGVVLFPH